MWRASFLLDMASHARGAATMCLTDVRNLEKRAPCVCGQTQEKVSRVFERERARRGQRVRLHSSPRRQTAYTALQHYSTVEITPHAAPKTAPRAARPPATDRCGVPHIYISRVSKASHRGLHLQPLSIYNAISRYYVGCSHTRSHTREVCYHFSGFEAAAAACSCALPSAAGLTPQTSTCATSKPSLHMLEGEGRTSVSMGSPSAHCGG